MVTREPSSQTTIALDSIKRIEDHILILRGQKVMLDTDLAELYSVETRTLNQAVKRNLERFPEDFMFQLSAEEAESLRSHSVTSKPGRGGRRYLPYAFSEHGAVMLASVLNSSIAIEVSIQVVRAFVRLRSILAAHKELARRLEALEKQTKQNFNVVFKLISQIVAEEEKPKRKIGFETKDK